MIAYLGKDRQDAKRANLMEDDSIFDEQAFGKSNPEIINNLIVNIVENSYGKDCIVMGNEYYKAIKATKKENYQKIYFNEVVEKTYKDSIRPMFHLMYEKLLADLQSGNENTIIYKHHIHFVKENTATYGNESYLELTESNQIVVDFMASMTDDYFVDLFTYLFPDSKYEIKYISYFEE